MAEGKDKPVFDEQTLARVLEAAWVMQEYNREQQKAAPAPEQKLDRIEVPDRLEVQNRLEVKDRIEVRGQQPISSPLAASPAPVQKPVADVEHPSIPASTIATQPGALEHDQDHEHDKNFELAGNSDEDLAAEHRKMLEELERLMPDLGAAPDAKESAAAAVAPATSASASPNNCRQCGHKLIREENFCGNCGTPRSQEIEPPSLQSKVATLWLMQEALGKNAPAVPADDEIARRGPQAIVRPLPAVQAAADSAEPAPESIDERVLKLFSQPELPAEEETESAESSEDDSHPEFDHAATAPALAAAESPLEADAEPEESTALVPSEPVADWSSAASARNYLEQLAGSRRVSALAQFWSSHRGDIYLAVAVIVVAFAIRLAIWSNDSVGASSNPNAAAHHTTAPEANLSLFDRVLIGLGLAVAPDAPQAKGNPNAQVWVDLHTALYYCSGAELYGKTPKGKFASQHDAQLDQFEPASGKACD